jgi:hypothetical protein
MAIGGNLDLDDRLAAWPFLLTGKGVGQDSQILITSPLPFALSGPL